VGGGLAPAQGANVGPEVLVGLTPAKGIDSAVHSAGRLCWAAAKPLGASFHPSTAQLHPKSALPSGASSKICVAWELHRALSWRASP